MERNELIQNLRQLHQELTRANADDDEVRSLLATVHEDIDRLEREREEEDKAPHTLEERLESLAGSFEAEHPRLAETARELVSLLSSIGI